MDTAAKLRKKVDDEDWAPLVRAVFSEGIKLAGEGGTNRDPIARVGLLFLGILSLTAWIAHEAGSGGFRDAMDATNEATWIMIDVICEAHPEARAKCKTAERKLNRR